MPVLGIIASSLGATQFGSFESIQTITVGSGGSANVTFSNIPQQYTHLQLRFTAASNRSTYTIDNIYLDRVNGSTASNLTTRAQITNDQNSTTVLNYNYINYDGTYIGRIGTSVQTNAFGAGVVDMLDYTNTNMKRSFLSFAGQDTNGLTLGYRGSHGLLSGTLNDTVAMTSFRLRPEYGTAFLQYSSFALYGIRTA